MAATFCCQTALFLQKGNRSSGPRCGWSGLRMKYGVPKGGLEPPCPCEHNALNVACLPISPLRRFTLIPLDVAYNTASRTSCQPPVSPRFPQKLELKKQQGAVPVQNYRNGNLYQGKQDSTPARRPGYQVNARPDSRSIALQLLSSHASKRQQTAHVVPLSLNRIFRIDKRRVDFHDYQYILFCRMKAQICQRWADIREEMALWPHRHALHLPAEPVCKNKGRAYATSKSRLG